MRHRNNLPSHRRHTSIHYLNKSNNTILPVHVYLSRLQCLEILPNTHRRRFYTGKFQNKHDYFHDENRKNVSNTLQPIRKNNAQQHANKIKIKHHKPTGSKNHHSNRNLNK